MVLRVGFELSEENLAPKVSQSVLFVEGGVND